MVFIDEDIYRHETGIYMIKNIETGAVYIGQTLENFQERYWNHRWKLNNKTHDNEYLQKSWNKHGSDAFEFSVVEVADETSIDEREKHLIQHFRNIGVCYNVQDGGQERCLVRHVSPEGRKKVGEINRQRMIGTKLSDETKRRMSVSRTGHRASRKTDVLTEEQAAKIKEMLVAGIRPSNVAREIGVSYRHVNNILSNDTFRDIHVDGWEEFKKNRKRKRHGVSEDEIAKMKELRDAGVSISDICRIIGCTTNTVKKYLK